MIFYYGVKIHTLCKPAGGAAFAVPNGYAQGGGCMHRETRFTE